MSRAGCLGTVHTRCFQPHGPSCCSWCVHTSSHLLVDAPSRRFQQLHLLENRENQRVSQPWDLSWHLTFNKHCDSISQISTQMRRGRSGPTCPRSGVPVDGHGILRSGKGSCTERRHPEQQSWWALPPPAPAQTGQLSTALLPLLWPSPSGGSELRKLKTHRNII